MLIPDVPDSSCPPLEFPHFPTKWQAVLWRNYNFIPLKKLAEILQCSEEVLTAAAQEMGLPAVQPETSDWVRYGYLTVIRNNWHLLDYEQMLELLEWTPERMRAALREEDFLWGKLGSMKPSCEKVVYSPLTAEEKTATELFRQRWQKHIPAGEYGYQEDPFAFSGKYRTFFPANGKEGPFSLRFVHSYAATCGDLLLDIESRDPVPENLLKEYAAQGINGIWFHVILYLLHPVKGSEEFSEGFETRLKNLARVVERCKKYGIGIYLYLNEPRGMTEAFYQKNPNWRGVLANQASGQYASCTSKGEVLPWMEEAIYTVFKRVPDLAGAFMITMSENVTHCNAQHKIDGCPLCRELHGSEIIGAIAHAAERGMHRAAPEAKLLMSDWAWAEKNFDHEAEFRKKVIDQLPQNVWFLTISEWGKAIQVGGTPNTVFDYSISQPGPSDESAEAVRYAKEKGLKVAAKIQANNSWELSSVPYIPVPYLIEEHIKRLADAGVDGIMLSWTHGGYPGGNLALIHSSTDELIHGRFREKTAEKLCQALRMFGDAFRNFPFDVITAYTCPANYGPMNLFHAKATGRKATMIGYPYDDLTRWRSCYPEDVFAEQFRKVSEGWGTAMEILAEAKKDLLPEEQELFREFEIMATGAYCHLYSTDLQIRFVRCREAGDLAGMKDAVAKELENTKRLYSLVREDSRIGFESSNHYYYSLNDLLEKIINCESFL